MGDLIGMVKTNRERGRGGKGQIRKNKEVVKGTEGRIANMRFSFDFYRGRPVLG